MDEDATKTLSRRDWEIVDNNNAGQGQYMLRGSRVSSPQRYQLLALLLLFITLISPQPLTAITGLWLAGWASRRFTLSVSADHGIELTSILLFPYRRIRLPLLSTQLKVIEVYSSESFSRLKQSPEQGQQDHLRLIDLALAHPELRESPVVLMRLEYHQGLKLCRLFASWTHVSHQRRSISSLSPLPLFNSEPGEWVIALLDLFPYLLGPRRDFNDIHTKLSYWAPRQTSIIITVIATLLACMIALISPVIAMSLVFGSLASLCAVREHIYIDHHHLIWRRSVFNITNDEKVFSPKVQATLERGIHTPSGRSVYLAESLNTQDSMMIGKPWDAAWIHREINKGLLRHTK